MQNAQRFSVFLYILTLVFSGIINYNYAILGRETIFKKMFEYKIDVLEELKSIGYNTNKLRTDKIFGESYIQQLRNNEIVSWKALDKICTLLNCDIGDVVKHVK